MALASCSSSVAAMRSRLLSTPVVGSTKGGRISQQTRTYAALPTGAYAPRKTRPTPPPTTYPSGNPTPAAAQNFVSNLFDLPPTRKVDPALALQALTHKSYRFAHGVRHPIPAHQGQEGEVPQAFAPQNNRLAFVGRMAMSTYMSLFIHDAYGSAEKLDAEGRDFLRGVDLQQRVTNFMNTTNVGRDVGSAWGLDGVMRFDGNVLLSESGYARIKGQTVEALMGVLYTQYGSPAAQRAFHLHLLPTLQHQLRDPLLTERVRLAKAALEEQFGRGILLEQ
ncbi:hypothetical protein IAT38_001354 [Cryptococcus sp. DSM 104549]